MVDISAHIEIVIDVEEPVELGDFVSAFTSIGKQYRRYMQKAYPDLKEDAVIYVRQVRPGSIIAELVPSFASLVALMDQALIVDQFIRVYGARLSQYFSTGGRQEDATKSELNEFIGQVLAIAKSKNGRGQLRAVSFEDGQRQIRAALTFNTEDAAKAIKEIEDHRQELQAIDSADHERVLMTFKRSDIRDAGIGARSGERVVIEQISERDLALIYGSRLAEEQIKDQMRNTDENIYHKGFVVDVNVTTKGGDPVAYSIKHVHQIINLDQG